MADKKISQLTAVTTLESTDDLVMARSGANKRISGAALLDITSEQASALIAALSRVSSFNGRSGIVVLVSSDLNGLNGSGLVGIGGGTGGVINTGSTTIGADSDANGTGVVALQTRGVTRFQIGNLGEILIGGATRETTIYASQKGAHLNTDLATGGGTDDTAIIQSILDLASGGQPIRLVMDGPALVGALDVYGNTTIECLAGGGFYLKDSTNRSLLRNANPTVDSVVDEHITLLGGVYNGNSANNHSGIGTFSGQEEDGTIIGIVQMYGVNHLKVHGVSFIDSVSICLHVSNCIDADIDDIYVDNNEGAVAAKGGLQIEGPSSNIMIGRIRGSSLDDLVSLSSDAGSYVNGDFTGLGPYITDGDITDISIGQVLGVGTGAFCGLRLFNGPSRIDRVTVGDITGVFRGTFFNKNFDGGSDEDNGNLGTLVVKNINATMALPVDVYQAMISISGKADQIIFGHINVNVPLDDSTILFVQSNAVIDYLEIGGLTIYDTDAGAAGMRPVKIAGQVSVLSIGGCAWNRGATLDPALVMFEVTGTVDAFLLSDARTNRVQYLVNMSFPHGEIRYFQADGVHQADAGGGATLLASVTGGGAKACREAVISNWHGYDASPVIELSAVLRKRGDAFPPDAVAPVFSSGVAISGTAFVIITFSKEMNAGDYKTGSAITKNASAQTISDARRGLSERKIWFTLGASMAGGVTMNWAYSVGGYVADWSGNLLGASSHGVPLAPGKAIDRFIAADDTAISGRTPSPLSPSHNWAVILGSSGKQTIQSNQAQLDGTTPALQAAAVDCGAADVLISVIATSEGLRATSANIGVIFRETDASNYWIFALVSDVAVLQKVVAGSPTNVSTPALNSYDGVPYDLELVLSGSSITCKVNGVTIATATDSFNATATKHGVIAYNCIGAFEDFVVTGPAV